MSKHASRHLASSAADTSAPATSKGATCKSATPAAICEEDEFGFSPPDYDPAEYRWVPVRRHPRRDGWTEEKQRRFIEVLADTGLVGLAAKEVGMTRQSAYRLRRAAYAGAFARAWDQARERAGALIEDIAFERAIEGVEVEVFDGQGELSGARTVYNDRLLTFLLRHLKPERYPAAARERKGTAWPEGQGAGAAGDGRRGNEASLDEALRAMEPDLPAPVEDLLDADDLADDLPGDLLTAEVADGKLPHFLSEQRAAKSPEQLRAEGLAAQQERGRLADEKFGTSERLTDQDFRDWHAYHNPQDAMRIYKKGQRRRVPKSGPDRGSKR